MDWCLRYLRTTANLHAGRLRSGLSQVRCARELSVSRRTFQRFESGETDPSARQLFRWAGLVGVDLASNLTPSGGDQ